MSAPRLVLVVGTRPEAIKVAPVVLAARRARTVEPFVLTTGQHEELVDRALAAFGVDVDHRLHVGHRAAGSQAELLGRLLPQLDEAFGHLGPAAVLVQGDTASALAGALAACWQRAPVVHLEAGLRSHDVDHPFPEETYRRLIADVARLHLAPTPAAAANLRAEGIAEEAVLCTGNTVVDAALYAGARADEAADPVTPGRRMVLLTIHRRENWGPPLHRVLDAVRRLLDRVPDLEVVVPVHPNPIVRRVVEEAAAGLDRFRVVEPLDHAELIAHLRAATLVLTDSGGIQEEAPSFATPVLVLRETTERPEAVAAGCAALVGTDADRLVDRAGALLEHEALRSAMARIANPFGDGASAVRAVHAVSWLLGLGPRPADWCPGRPLVGASTEVTW